MGWLRLLKNAYHGSFGVFWGFSPAKYVSVTGF